MEATDTDTVPQIPNAFLRGIPVSLLIDGARERRVDEVDENLKLFMGNRHEHFRPLAETVTIGGRELRVFEWTHSTFVAE
ncbi:DUF5988 family protein [Actinocrinis sp.]|jgi:uncharacterized protein DUF5988|uniref:DUF5988 family protein n=1 Tax=Actinocrinis sp. TaxID=1920516 RepID=UPI002BC2DE11|nr:DUF5988 family protein [Actinocrinis sp.]HXR69794.1 DUF5988 family protein [Actinocrinis sp.]